MHPMRRESFPLSFIFTHTCYFYFGERIVAQILGAKQEDKITGIIYDKVYERFVEEIDAIDNGISQCDEEPRWAQILIHVHL